MQDIVNVISYKLIALSMQKRDGLDPASRESKKFSEFTPYIMLKNDLLASTTNITFFIDLVFLWSLNHICFTKLIMAQE